MVTSIVPERALNDLLAVAKAAPPGSFAEFGVYQGGAAQHLAEIARSQGRALYLFDTFTGIPFRGEHDVHRVGDFGDTSVEAVRELIPDAVIVEGIFPGSSRGMVFDAPLAFVHVDADQFQSVLSACLFFPDHMAPGGVMLFDDYNCLDGATRAVDTWARANEYTFDVTEQGKALWRKP